MKTPPATILRNSAAPTHPPLACDVHGNAIAVPDDAAAWTLKRVTGGRPRTIVGPDRQPVRFPLDVNAADLEAMLGPGTFRVYAITEVGEELDHVTTLVLGEAEEASAAARSPVVGLEPRSSDLRYALETILELARAQSESLKAVSLAQADWVKGLATAKALPRNGYAPPPPPAPAPAPSDDEEEDAEGVDDEAPAEMPRWMEAVAMVAPALQTYGEVLKARFASTPQPPPSPPPARNAAPARPNPMIHLSKIQARLTRPERNLLGVVLRGDGGDEVTEHLLELGIADAVAFVQDQYARLKRRDDVAADDEAFVDDVPPPPTAPPAPQELTPHVLAAAAHLTADERAAVLRLLPRFPAARLEALKVQLLSLAPRDAAAWIRDHLDALQAEVGS